MFTIQKLNKSCIRSFFFFLCTNYSFIKMVIKKIEQVVKNLIGATIYIFFYLGFLSQPFTNHRTTGEGETISLTPHYHFHPLHRHLDIGRAITVESSPLHISSSRTRTRNLWFSSVSR